MLGAAGANNSRRGREEGWCNGQVSVVSIITMNSFGCLLWVV